MKKVICSLLSFALLFAFCGCSKESKGKYTPGTYQSISAGNGGDVVIDVTFDSNKINSINVVSQNETKGLGDVAIENMIKKVIDDQSVEVDTESGATISSNALLTAVKKAMDEAMGVENDTTIAFTPGTYTGTAKGRNGDIEVAVTFSEDAITNVEIVNQTETYGLAYGLTTSPVEVYPSEIVETQSISLDTIAGATLTCSAIKTAVSDAIIQAGMDPEVLRTTKQVEITNEVYDTDVVVLGAGGAGLSAAISATDAGANVIVLEAQGITGGACARSGGKIIAANTKWQQAQSIVDTPELMFEYLKEVGGDQINDSLVELYSEKSADNMYWLESKGVQFQDVEAIHSSLTPWRVHNPYGGGGQVSGGSGNGAQITVPLTQYLENTDTQIIYDARANELILDKEGRVAGVKAVKSDGSTVTVNAKNVIICTGGYTQNREMMSVYDSIAEGYTTLVPSTNQGDGLVMAGVVGAQIYNAPSTQVIYVSTTCGVGISEEAGLIIGADGTRVTNEYTYQYHVGQAIASKGSYGYYIASATDPNRRVQYGLTLESTPHAATPEELATLIDLDPEVLSSTISRYNELCASGNDEDFGKPADKMVALEGELYAIKLTPAVTVTYGGLVIDENSHVLDVNNQVIEGLYAAGEVAMTGLTGDEYPSCGLAVGTATFFGSIAGENAANNK